jgi:hypothetical protein
MTMQSSAGFARIVGSVGNPSKMPGTAYGISAYHCITGGKLAQVNGSVCEDCYAVKGNYIGPTVKRAHADRERSLRNLPLWTETMAKYLAFLHGPKGPAKGKSGNPINKGWHRWHDAGDLQSVEHLAAICEVARRTPEIRHWLPTRELAFVRQYVRDGGIVPNNLAIRVSATMVDGPATKAWGTTSGVHTREDSQPAGTHYCPAPTHGGTCNHPSDASKHCRACWSNDVAHVSYHKH